MTQQLLAALAAIVVSLLVTPIVRRIAIKFNALAKTNQRTIHKSDIPKLGGIGIFVAFVVGIFLLDLSPEDQFLAYGIVIGGGVLVVVGFFDDLYLLSCYRKLVFQALAALVAIYFGFGIESIALPLNNTLSLGWWSVPFSVLWFVGITNAINLLDGLDGLASGFTVLLGLFVVVVSGFTGNSALGSVALVLVMATLGFLRYNFYPAKIFMGDTGSLFLGFVLACITTKAFTTSVAGTHLSALFLPFALPLADTTLAVVRRISAGHHPFCADKKHIHHKLLEQGLAHSAAVIILYGVTVLSGLTGIFVFFTGPRHLVLILAVVIPVSTFALNQLGCFDFCQRERHPSEAEQRCVESE